MQVSHKTAIAGQPRDAALFTWMESILSTAIVFLAVRLPDGTVLRFHEKDQDPHLLENIWVGQVRNLE